MTQLRHEAVLRLKSWKASRESTSRFGVEWRNSPVDRHCQSTCRARRQPTNVPGQRWNSRKKGKWEEKKLPRKSGKGEYGGGARIGRKSCGFSGVSGMMCEEERLCSCRAPWRRADRLRANALWKCPGGKGWIGGGAQASSWYRRFDSRAEGKKRIQTVVVKPSSGRPSANVRSTWWQPRLVRAALIWDLVVRSRRAWFWGSTFDRWIRGRDVSGVMGERRNREG